MENGMDISSKISEYFSKNAGKQLGVRKMAKDLKVKRRTVNCYLHEHNMSRTDPISLGSMKKSVNVYQL